jgi:Ca2+-binding RTX toxin-like protein
MTIFKGTGHDDYFDGTDLGNSDDVVKGAGGDDTLDGGDGRDRIDGGAGNDYIYGGSDGFVDTVLGGLGDDVVVASGGDILDGGADFDQLSIRLGGATANLTVDLSGTTSQTATVVSVDVFANMTVSGFEYVSFVSGSGADSITLGNATGAVDARGGNDTVTGGAGNDFVRPGLGDDIIDGGQGFDRVGYFGVAGGVHVSLALQGQAQDTGAGMDTLKNIEGLSGTAEADLLIGDSKSNVLWGNVGDDTLRGGGGDDMLWLSPVGTALADGGSGSDSVVFNNNSGTGGFTDGLNVDLARQGVVQDFGQMSGVLKNIENVSGSDFDDILKGNAVTNVLAGDDGSDVLTGGGGGDSLYGDGLIFQDGFNSGPIIFLRQGDPGFIGDDFLSGGAGADTLVGGLGSDMLVGGGGGDTFVFIDADDSLDTARDYIADLSNLKDVIDLSAIDADTSTQADDAFTQVGTLTGAGQFTLQYDAGEDVTLLSLDIDGGGADTVVEIAGKHDAFTGFVL